LAKKKCVELKVLTTDTAGPWRTQRLAVEGFPTYFEDGYRVYFCRKLFGRDFSPSLLFRLWPMIGWADIVHLTAVYSAPTIPALLMCRLLHKPLVWSPRGALQRWERTSKPGLKWAWEMICGTLIRSDGSFLHVTADQEAVATRTRIPGIAIAVIPNGVDVPSGLPPRTWTPEGILRLIFLGRLHPIKGIENLLRGDDPKGRWLLTFAFGLIHGFGFASVLRELGVGANGSSIAVPLVSFNLGVEIGQIVIPGLVLPVIWKLRSNPSFVRRAVPVGSLLVALLGSYWFIQRVWF